MTIEVYCGDSSHAPRRFSWVPSRDTASGLNHEVWGTLWHPVGWPWPKGFIMRGLTVQALGYTGFTGPDRLTYEFKCDWCKCTVPVRGEKLKLILDTLDEHGVSSLSLTGLAARLAGTA